MARPRHFRIRAVVALALLAAFAACRGGTEGVVLATTSSVGNSGLLDAVLSRYEVPVRPLLVGSGRAIEMLGAGQADVIISHAPAREAHALREHPTWFYRKILYNDFLIVGPADDPAGVVKAASAADAMRRIAASEGRFLSRGDESGTHERERELWKLADAVPDSARLVVAGAGMGQTLRIASSTAAYTLTDRGTFETLRAALALAPLFEGDPVLLNTYAVIADPDRVSGMAFAAWLSGERGRQALQDAVRDGGVRGFSVWPEGAAADRVDALPGR